MRPNHALMTWSLVLMLLVLNAPRRPTLAAEYPSRPGERDFVVDQAELISKQHDTRIRGMCDKLLTETKVPIIVVTVSSLAEQGAGGWAIERYATSLFNEWGIGHADRNLGILLLVSKGDRQARIELGADWAHKKNRQCRRIMDKTIIPHFKKGQFSEGILAGVKALDAMARGRRMPAEPGAWKRQALILGLIVLGIFTIVSLVRRGSSGMAWLLWAAVFGVIGWILYQMVTSRSGSGGSWGGGSFGGGFSGGGGATGSW